jgi:two-component system cell cycle response regulator
MTEQSGHILVVDDHRTNLLKMSFAVKKLGHTTALAKDGQEALDMLRAQSFDLVLLDIVMPVMDGYQVLEEMKADTVLRDIPVVVISAQQEMESIVKGIELGAEDYLPKTFDPVLLEARVGACLEKKRLRDQEVEYLRNVALVTDAAATVEGETFDPEALGLDDVAARTDALGRLARVFQKMAREVYAREQRLKLEVKQLRIKLDEAQQARKVAEVTETEFFQNLLVQADDLRSMFDETDEG